MGGGGARMRRRKRRRQEEEEVECISSSVRVHTVLYCTAADCQLWELVSEAVGVIDDWLEIVHYLQNNFIKLT